MGRRSSFKKIDIHHHDSNSHGCSHDEVVSVNDDHVENLTYDIGDKDQRRNKAIYRQNYATEFELPHCYIMDAKVYPTNNKFVLQVIRYTMPIGCNEVQIHEVDKSNRIKYKPAKTMKV